MTAEHQEVELIAGIHLRAKCEGERTLTYFHWGKHRVPWPLGVVGLNIVIALAGAGVGAVLCNPLAGLAIGLVVCVAWTVLAVEKVREFTRYS